MTNSSRFHFSIWAGIACLMSSGQVLAVAFGFSPGHIYSTQFFETDISEYSTNGRLLATTSIEGLQPGEETKGLGFGPDGNLYIVLDRLFEGARLVSVDSTGAIVNSYELPVATGGNLSYGKLGFDDDGMVYIGTGAGIVRVRLGDANSAQLLGDDTADAFDLSVLPNGNLSGCRGISSTKSTRPELSSATLLFRIQTASAMQISS
jgi:hypothetical protein